MHINRNGNFKISQSNTNCQGVYTLTVCKRLKNFHFSSIYILYYNNKFCFRSSISKLNSYFDFQNLISLFYFKINLGFNLEILPNLSLNFNFNLVESLIITFNYIFNLNYSFNVSYKFVETFLALISFLTPTQLPPQEN